MKRHSVGWSNLQDPASRAAIDFGAYGVPETYFVDRHGRIAHKHIGPVTDDILARGIDRLLGTASESTAAGAT